MNLSKMQNLMRDRDISVLVTFSVENTYYTTGNYSLITKTLGNERLAISIIPSQGEPIYLVSVIEESLTRDETWITDIRTYGYTESHIKCLMDILYEKKLLDGQVALEMTALSADLYQELTALAPKTAFVDGTDILSTMRAIKDEKEIELLTVAAHAQRKAIEAAYEMARPGDTEKYIARLIASNMLALGLDTVVEVILGAGSSTLKVHALPSDRKLVSGDILRVDCLGQLKGYCSDLARTSVVGKASEDQRQVFRALVRGQKAAIDHMHVGAKISDVYNVCKKTFEENYPAPFTSPFIAHGLGLYVHEAPYVHPDNEGYLEENMVICVEPVYVHQDAFYQIEDLVLISSSGPKVLSDAKFNDEIAIIR